MTDVLIESFDKVIENTLFFEEYDVLIDIRDRLESAEIALHCATARAECLLDELRESKSKSKRSTDKVVASWLKENMALIERCYEGSLNESHEDNSDYQALKKVLDYMTEPTND